MNMLTPKALVACAVMGMTCGPVAAQTTAKTPASATAPKPKPKAPAKAAPPPPPLVLADADEDQQRAFSLAHVGEHLCEFSQSLKVLANPSHAGYADVHFGKQVVTTKPVLSSTGALRFEDVRGQFLLVGHEHWQLQATQIDLDGHRTACV